jgi:hypothetical protein
MSSIAKEKQQHKIDVVIALGMALLYGCLIDATASSVRGSPGATRPFKYGYGIKYCRLARFLPTSAMLHWSVSYPTLASNVMNPGVKKRLSSAIAWLDHQSFLPTSAQVRKGRRGARADGGRVETGRNGAVAESGAAVSCGRAEPLPGQ